MAGEIRKDITKKEAAERQLDTAINLLFLDADAISIHVLASSASVILTDVCKLLGKQSFKAIYLDYINDMYKKEVHVKMKKAYNFFKHANRDAEVALEHFDSEINLMEILGACVDFTTVYGQMSIPMKCFFGWMVGINPNFFNDALPIKGVIRSAFPGIDQKEPNVQLKIGLDALHDLCALMMIEPPIRIIR